jgi:ABC-type branched-subunit amino acid transport system substrate-binding protein
VQRLVPGKRGGPGPPAQGVSGLSLSADRRETPTKSAFIRFFASFADEMDALIALVREKGFRRVAVLYADVDTMRFAVEDYLRPRLTELGVELTVETYDFSTGDVRPQILKLDRARPQAVRLLDYGDKLQSILTQVQEAGAFRDADLISGIEALALNPAAVPAELTERFRFIVPELITDPDNPTIAKFTRRFGSPPIFEALIAYDAIRFLAGAALAEQGDPGRTVQRIRSTQSFQGAAARYEKAADGGLSPRLVWAHIQDGKVRAIDR